MSALEHSTTRIRGLLILCLAGFAFLTVALARVQLGKQDHYGTVAARQTFRRILTPAPRGRIFDRNGICLADNAPTYCIALNLETLCDPRWSRRQALDEIQTTISRLAATLGRRYFYNAPDRNDILHHLRIQSPMPLMLWSDVDPVAAARWAERSTQFPGVELIPLARRHYAMPGRGALFRGGVRRANPTQPDGDPFHYCLPDMEGTWGVEKACNETLAGTPGEMVVAVDARGYRRSVVSRREPVSGHDVHLTVDMRIQCTAEHLLDGKVGAIVVLDPQSGEILALASSPSIRLGASARQWQAYRGDADEPCLDRTRSKAYPPGSTFKPVLSLAALSEGLWDERQTVACHGFHVVGRRRVSCWLHRGHGRLDLPHALQQSCNTYFCRLATECGMRSLRIASARLGYGTRTGMVPALAEAPGILPGPAWKEQHEGTPWTAGDTCNIALGQGALEVTPLQAAVAVAAIGNGGTVLRPRLVQTEAPPPIVRQIRWPPHALEAVHDGMEAVIHTRHGTGRAARHPQVRMCGKTGTAQYGTQLEPRNYAWMTLFAPRHNPRYAVAIVLEDAESGGRSAAPLAGRLVEAIFRQDQPDESPILLAASDRRR